MAIFISRQIVDGQFVNVGTAMTIPRAGVLLAHLTRCPNLYVGMGGSVVTNFVSQSSVRSIEFTVDGADSAAEGYMSSLFEDLRLYDLFFVGGLQVDQFGNVNLIGVGKDYPRLRLRGPGSVGVASTTTYARRYFICVNGHNRRIFVPQCDYISSFGWGRGGADARQKLGLPGGGPQFVITPLGIMDFDEQSKRMRLRHVAPRSSIEDVVRSTGFDLLIPPELQEIDPPTAEELAVLRSRVDPQGLLRGERE